MAADLRHQLHHRLREPALADRERDVLPAGRRAPRRRRLNYQFRLTDTAYAPLTFGTTIDGTVTNATQSDVYTFTGTAGERIYFEDPQPVQRVYGAHLVSLRTEQREHHATPTTRKTSRRLFRPTATTRWWSYNNTELQHGHLQLRGFSERQPDLDADPGHRGDRDDRQPGRLGHLHLHRHGRPADLLRRPRLGQFLLVRRADRPVRHQLSSTTRPAPTKAPTR